MTKQEQNIEIVKNFYEEVFNAHNNSIAVLDKYMRNDYSQHNGTVKDGKVGFIEFTNMFFKADPKMEIKKIFANGDEVAVFFKCTCQANGSINKVVDIYRLEDGKLAEHWDVVEHDIEDIIYPNGNGVF